MQSLTQPVLLLKPFAESGDKNTIPVTNTDSTNPQRADLTNGFPAITSETPDNNGLPPERKDFNALGYLTTTYDFFYQAGGQYTFDSTISTAIGGYPEGARLWYRPAGGDTIIVRSLIDDNTYDFVSDPTLIDDVHWTVDVPSMDVLKQIVRKAICTDWSSAPTNYSSGQTLPSDGFVFSFETGGNLYVNGIMVGNHSTQAGSGWTTPVSNACCFARAGDVITGSSFYFKPLDI